MVSNPRYLRTIFFSYIMSGMVLKKVEGLMEVLRSCTIIDS